VPQKLKHPIMYTVEDLMEIFQIGRSTLYALMPRDEPAAALQDRHAEKAR